MSNTPEIDEVEKYSGITVKGSVTTCGDESSSVYVPVIFARQLERERDEARQQREYLRELHNKNAIYSKELLKLCGTLRKERDKAINAIRETLEENRHLADGDDCTLRKLKAIVPDWK